MGREAKRVRANSDSDVARFLDEVHADGEPRIIEKNGEDIAAIVPVDFVASSEAGNSVQRALALAGAWKDLDTEDLERRIEENRHASPPSQPVDL